MFYEETWMSDEACGLISLVARGRAALISIRNTSESISHQLRSPFADSR